MSEPEVDYTRDGLPHKPVDVVCRWCGAINTTTKLAVGEDPPPRPVDCVRCGRTIGPGAEEPPDAAE